MPVFKLSLKCLVKTNFSFKNSSSGLGAFQLNGSRVQVEYKFTGPNFEVNELVLQVTDFASFEAAKVLSEKLEYVMLCLGLYTDAGIKLLEPNIREQVPGQLPMLEVKVTGYVTPPSTPWDALQNLTTELSRLGENSLQKDQRVRTALELYNLASYETSPVSQFITLVTSVESLVEQAEHNQTVKEIIEKCRWEVESSEIDDETKKSLEGVLGRAKKESVGLACRRLIQEHLDNEAARFFKKAYDLRSKILHEGERPSNQKLQLHELKPVVQRLLKTFASGT